MRKSLVAVLLSLTWTAFAQAQNDNYAVLFDGIVAGDSPLRFVIDKDLDNLSPDNRLLPGIEFRYSQRGHIGGGLSYRRFDASSPLETEEFFTQTTDPEGNTTQALVLSRDVSRQSKIHQVVATIYVYPVRLWEERIVPRIGIGGGVYILETTSASTTTFDRFDAKTPFSETFTDKTYDVPITGSAGVDIFPTRHLMFSIGGGYLNSATFNFAVGFTF